jgi:hypothetical protein
MAESKKEAKKRAVSLAKGGGTGLSCMETMGPWSDEVHDEEVTEAIRVRKS